jgi:hypothetical protein
LSYAYSQGGRVRKTVIGADTLALHTLKVFDTLRVEQAQGPHPESKAIHRAASMLVHRTVDYSQINNHNRLGSSHAEWHEERYKNS